MVKQVVLVFITFSLFSCEKDINLELNPGNNSLVVDANIESNSPPFVVLSKSLDYFSKVTPALISASYIHQANVSLTDGSQNIKLKEDSITDFNGNKSFFYTSPPSSIMLGKPNTTYTLTIQVGNNIYTSTTTIPEITVKIDSVWWVKRPVNNDPSYCMVMLRIKDKPGFGDYYRCFTKVNKGLFVPLDNSVFDDKFFDGDKIEISMDPRVDEDQPDEKRRTQYKRGDSITLKICQIDKATYNFWQTFEYSLQSVDNPFANPIKIQSNISNNALGYFGGYSVQYHTLIIPKL